ncbi:MAG TPA: hypothetical protein VLZ29_02030 [Sulfurimonas sp.]|uniref:hypothetical protein n=1 Tax=Sulfurimonas sp. TaxID=2022749 RepID=UPI002BECA297|nr:hypothetical protein [Sulfurimonas sp.]HUH41874.1 hypothetical protein [Sulfurimonas sp.]
MPAKKKSTKAKKLDIIDFFFSNISAFDMFLDQKLDLILLKFINILRYAFIMIMIAYLAVCLMSLFHKVVSYTLIQGVLDFASIKIILTDGLFTLIVLAIVKTLFIKDNFDYAITFLEITFVVLVRKMIVLETDPSETILLFVLGLTSALFFILIVYIHMLKKKDKKEQKLLEEK